MILNLTRGLLVAAVAVALLAPAPVALARPADDGVAPAPPSAFETVTGWLSNVLQGLFAASSTAPDEDGSEAGAEIDPDGASLTQQSSPDDGGERGPYIDPNG